ncbi:SGNH/GDSL hydrolase family protein [Photobacterium sp. TY1-4]|uniref:SGNH/GDSL hydrolase family protein n=1 Tax=Photobacterium sp. TY1-4 TaxID=2899122 RepID=UPI0021BF625E|nr:SGNH/GDSL hydrolase family protein [Photobacterium sp. TY1-4]UXI00913.1 GDSL-type esterase/lipase family protein [Photobacterium sp. TY1-4]
MSWIKVLFSACLMVMSGQLYAETLSATDYRINYEGRVVKDWNTGNVELSWPGSKIKFQFNGTRLAVKMDGRGTQFDVVVDDVVESQLTTTIGLNDYELLRFTEPRDVRVELVKRNESYDAMLQVHGFEADGMIQGWWEHKPHLLFFGDSITVGYGVESDKRECTLDEVSNTTNNRLSYASLAADALGASRTIVAYSGLGLVRNWNGNQPYHNLPYYWNKAGSVFTAGEEFEDKHSDLIVINLGGNDFSTPLQPHEPWPDLPTFYGVWIQSYVDFISQLRGRYGEIPILVISKDWYREAIHAMESQLFAQGILQVYTHYYMTEHLGCMWHPIASEHRVMADNLVSRINELSLIKKN